VGREEVVGRNAIVGQYDSVADCTDTVSTSDVRVVTGDGLLGFVELQRQTRLTAETCRRHLRCTHVISSVLVTTTTTTTTTMTMMMMMTLIISGAGGRHNMPRPLQVDL